MAKHHPGGGFSPTRFAPSFSKAPLHPPMTFKSPFTKPHQFGGALAKNMFKQSQVSRHHAHMSTALPKMLPKRSEFHMSAGHKRPGAMRIPSGERVKAIKAFDAAIKVQARMIKHQGHVKQMLAGTTKVVNSRPFKSEFPKVTRPMVTLHRNLAETRKNSVALQASAKAAYAQLNSSRKSFEKGKPPSWSTYKPPRFADQGKLHRTQAALLGRIARTLRVVFGTSAKPPVTRPKPGARTPPLDVSRKDKPPRRVPPPAKDTKRPLGKPERQPNLQEHGALPRKLTPELRERLGVLKQEQRERNRQGRRPTETQNTLRDLRERLRVVGSIRPPTSSRPVTRRANHEDLEREFTLQSPAEALRVQGSSSSISTVASRFEHNTYRGSRFNDDPRRGLLTRMSPDSSDNQGSETNAFRHAVWQALITEELGTGIALRVGDAHEGGRPLSRSGSFRTLEQADNQADLRNNHFGRLIGLSLAGKSPREIALGVLTFFRDYGLWVVRQDGARYIPERHQITEAQFRAAVRMIATTDDEGYTPSQRSAAD